MVIRFTSGRGALLLAWSTVLLPACGSDTSGDYDEQSAFEPAPQPSNGDDGLLAADGMTNAVAFLGEIERQYNTTYESYYTKSEITTRPVGDATFIYRYDCSGLLDMAFKNVRPGIYSHFAEVIGNTGTRLTTAGLADFFNSMGPDDPYWALVAEKDGTPANLIDAVPGDVLLYRKSIGTGHVMIVRRNLGYKPRTSTEILLEVYDAAESRHSSDSTRYHGATYARGNTTSSGYTGLGFGTLSVTMTMKQYRWRGTETGSALQSVSEMYLARLVDRTTPTIPAPPENLTATAGDGEIHLTWTAAAGATSYNVKSATDGPYATIQSGVTTTSYTHTGLSNGVTRSYVVTAVNAAGESVDSSPVAATTIATAFTISASAGSNGAINPSGAVLVKPGADQSFTFSPAADHVVDTVTVDGVALSNPANSYTFPGVAADHTIRVTFKAVQTATNIAPSGTGYEWSRNTVATANSNRVSNTSVRDGNLITTASVNSSTFDKANAWEAVGVILSTAKTVSSVAFINGTLSVSGQGFFDASLTLQYTMDGTTWVESGWTAMSPVYPYDASAANQTYALSGPPLPLVRGVRISGQVATHGTLPSRYFRYKELLVYGY